MHVPIGYKFIMGFVIVVATVALVPDGMRLLGYSPEISNILTYVVGITIGLIMGWLFSRSFTRNISLLTASAEAISRGDLTRDAVVGKMLFPDETRELADSINRMVGSLRELVGHIRETSENVTESARTLSSSALEVNASTEEVAQAMEQISRGAETQSEMVGRSSKVIHEMAISVELVANRAKESAKAARETSLTARKGGELANDFRSRMKYVFETLELAGRQFSELNAKLQQVGNIADFIGNIARQTNMLALNASIEAARAGEYGKGFAVVAEEVRKLADGTAKYTDTILSLIVEIKGESLQVHKTFSESSRQIVESRQTIDSTAASFQEIVTTVMETERKANSISDLSQMQTDGAEKMVKAIDEIAKVAEDNAAATEEVSAATEEQSAAMQEMVNATRELAKLADDLFRIVERFTVSAGGSEA
jgi:methyl-accepting chemotaxis protein